MLLVLDLDRVTMLVRRTVQAILAWSTRRCCRPCWWRVSILGLALLMLWWCRCLWFLWCCEPQKGRSFYLSSHPSITSLIRSTTKSRARSSSVRSDLATYSISYLESKHRCTQSSEESGNKWQWQNMVCFWSNEIVRQSDTTQFLPALWTALWTRLAPALHN